MLKQQHIKPNDIANSIFDAAPCDLLTEPIQRDSRFVTESNSIDTVTIINKSKYISFINYRLLEDLVSIIKERKMTHCKM